MPAHFKRLAWLGGILAGALLLAGVALPPVHGQAEKSDLAARAQAILKKNCYDCHGDPDRPLRGKLNLFKTDHLLDKGRKIVVAGAPEDSVLIQRIADDDQPMPPKGRKRLEEADREALRAWIAAGASLDTLTAATTTTTREATTPRKDPGCIPLLAREVKQLLRQRCQECHGEVEPQAGVTILNHAGLLKSGIVTPSKPEASELYDLLTTTDENKRMPKPGEGRAAFNQAEQDMVRDWIVAGAPEFPSDVKVQPGTVGEEYVLKSILGDIRRLRDAGQEVTFVRYFSFNHLLAAGITEEELKAHQQALTLIVNHLSLLPEFEVPTAVEPTKTVFRIDLRNLGWDRRPYSQPHLNLFDLALLEYPYGIANLASPTFDALHNEYLALARPVRPIPYVRGDWFLGVAAQPPLYEDFLLLPFDLDRFEQRLGVDRTRDQENGSARRAGTTASRVSHNNRIVERHSGSNFGYYWKSFDFRSSRGQDNMFLNPVDLHPSGGEMIFRLQNGLQGYFVCDARGNRLEAAPTEIVTDKFATDQVVRNGMSCIRCHGTGTNSIKDEVRPAMKTLLGSPGTFDKRDVERLYAESTEMDEWVRRDGSSYQAALARLFGKNPPTGEVVADPAHRFLDEKLQLRSACAEVGVANPEQLRGVFAGRDFAALGLVQLGGGGAVRRDTWEDFYEQVVRNLNAGEPVVPLDGLTRKSYTPNPAPFDLEVTLNKPATDTKNKVQIVLLNSSGRGIFAAGDTLQIQVINNTATPVCLEAHVSSFKGKKMIVPPGEVRVDAGKEAKFPKIVIQPGLGGEQLVFFAADSQFPPGERLAGRQSAEDRGEVVADRIVHDFYQLEQNGRGLRLAFNPARMVKRTFDIETR